VRAKISFLSGGNNSTDPRDANINITIDGRTVARHTIHQERRSAVSIRSRPKNSASDRRGERVVQRDDAARGLSVEDHRQLVGVQITGPTNGVGAGTVNYTVAPNTSVFDRPLRVQGLSGLNPPGTHTVVIGG
jgi:hypothetical protein